MSKKREEKKKRDRFNQFIDLIHSSNDFQRCLVVRNAGCQYKKTTTTTHLLPIIGLIVVCIRVSGNGQLQSFYDTFR